MDIDVLTLFPRIVESPLEESILKRACDRGLIQVNIYNIRDFTHDKHHIVDDKPYGGGQGMLLKPEPIFEAMDSIKRVKSCVIYMTPQGQPLTQQLARRFASESHIVIICGHYEGIDERVREALVDQEVSIGDYVLTNGALAASVFIDVVVRLLPGVLGDEQSAEDDSFSTGLLEGPQYTRPPVYRGMKVPDVLLSGDHKVIRLWRREQSKKRTKERRPDLLKEENP